MLVVFLRGCLGIYVPGYTRGDQKVLGLT